MSEASARSASGSITRRVKKLREEHLERMIQTSVNPSLSLACAGLLTDYRRVRAHTLNVHQAMTGERTMAVAD